MDALTGGKFKSSSGQWFWCDVPDSNGPPVKHGPYTVLHDNGKVKIEGQFDRKHRTADWQWFHNTGQKTVRGAYEIVDSQGSLSERVGPLDQHKHRVGYWEAWHDDGTKRLEGSFENGLLVGRWRVWHSNGQLKFDVECNEQPSASPSRGAGDPEPCQGEEWKKDGTKRKQLACRYGSCIVLYDDI